MMPTDGRRALWQQRRELRKEREEIRELARGEDPELALLAREELEALEQRTRQVDQELRQSFLEEPQPRGTWTRLEIRAGAGGQEAAIFAANLLRMYLRYAQQQGWEAEVAESRPQEPGGVSQATMRVQGQEAYRKLRNESGTHRVQRVPSTEAQGRIHTSTATVAVLQEKDIPQAAVRAQDLRVETMRSSGHGGQAVNKLATRVRIVHIPTGTTVTRQDERSLKQNREKAMEALQEKLQEEETRRARNETAGERRAQVGTASRQEKIRTYNYQQDRVTDHRLQRSFHPLQRVMDGDLGPISQALESRRGPETPSRK